MLNLIKNMKGVGLFFKYIFVFIFVIFKSQSSNEFYITDSNGDQNPVINCNYPFVNGSCVALTAHYPSYKSTSSYSVSSAVYQPYSSASKTVIQENLDDAFTGIINLPFSFCFYDKSYQQLVIGSNGMISFDVTQANQPNAPNFSDTLPSSNLPKESIFGALHDMYFYGAGSEMSYSVIGTAPYRKFIVNFTNGRISGCDSGTSTSQIVLSETLNTIEIFIGNKNLPCDLAKFKNALIGINDATGTLGMAAPGRNTGLWEAQQEAWVFAPSGAKIIPRFIWYNGAGDVIGSSENQNVCPSQDEKYKVDMIYTICSGETKTYTDTIDVVFSSDYPTVKSYSKVVCSVSEQIILADYKTFLTSRNPSNFNFEFIDKATGQPVNENTPFSVNANRSFTVVVSNKTLPNCKRTTTLDFVFSSDKILTNSLFICDFKNDGVENNYILSAFNQKLVGAFYPGKVFYYKTEQDALDNKNEITQTNIVEGTLLFVRLVNQTCVNVLGPIEVHFNPTPTVPSSIDAELKICDINNDRAEAFNWIEFVKTKITLDPDVTVRGVYASLAEADRAAPLLTQISAGNYKVYVRLEYSTGCYSVFEMNMKVVFEAIVLRDFSTDICFDGVQDIAVNLDDFSKNILISPTDGSVTGPYYYSTYQEAVNNDSSKRLQANQLITDNSNFVTKKYYVRFEKGNDCYTIKTITVNLVHLVKNMDSFKLCDQKNDGKETVNLSIYNPYVNNQSSTQVSFFSTEAAANANIAGTNISSAEINGSLTVYARVSYSVCSLVFPVVFDLEASPKIASELNIVLDSICDNNADGKEMLDVRMYESQININNENLDFSYYQNYNAANNSFSNLYSNPTGIILVNGSVVYVKATNRNTGCFSISVLKFSMNFYPPILLNTNAVIKKCDPELNFKEAFTLEEAIPQLFSQGKNTEVQLTDLDVTFYTTQEDANNGTTVGKIASPYVTYIGNTFVYARFQSRVNGCFSVAPLNLQSYFPVKARNSVITVCDNNLDGYYDVNLLDYKNQMVQIPSDENVYTFYLNAADIGILGKEIKDPAHFILNPFVSKIWVYAENLKDCGSSAEVNFKKGITLSLPQNQFELFNICDQGNDGKEIIDLSGFEATVGATNRYLYFETKEDMMANQNRIANPAAYPFDVSRGISKYYVQVLADGYCPNYYTIDVKINKTPIFKINDYYYCKNDQIGLDIRPNFTGLDVINYQWKYPDGTVLEGPNQDFITGVKRVGTYQLILTNSSNCSYTVVFKVINIDTPEITRLYGENDVYIIETSSIKGRTVLYSKDLITWQESNTFRGLQPGDYTFYVRYADSECLGDMKRGKIFTVINTITPNSDGKNDVWKLTGLDVFPEKSVLQIFDRFGTEVFHQESNTEFVWDGKINARGISTDTYWYIINAADGRVYKGWILLKNRN